MQDIIFNIGSTKVPPHSVMLDKLEKTKKQLTYVYICVHKYICVTFCGFPFGGSKRNCRVHSSIQIL
jgi:hypothetical protein